MEECCCCKVVKGKGTGFQEAKYVVELEGGWVLNHYGGEKPYLGYLILQTKRHRTDFGELSVKEATSLGTNIQRINQSLRQYWGVTYGGDSIERIYIAYFNETPFIKHLGGRKLLEASHVHMHLLPRTKRMGEVLNYCGRKLAFSFVENIDKLPEEYVISDRNCKTAKNLMSYLKKSLST